MLELIEQDTENFEEQISSIQAYQRELNTQIPEEIDIDPVEWRLTNQIKDVKHDIKAVKTDLTDYINQVKNDLENNITAVKTDLTDYIKEVKDDLTNDIQRVETNLRGDIQKVEGGLKSEIQNVRTDLKSDMKEQQSSLKWFIGIFVTAGVAVIGVMVTLITLFVK